MPLSVTAPGRGAATTTIVKNGASERSGRGPGIWTLDVDLPGTVPMYWPPSQRAARSLELFWNATESCAWAQTVDVTSSAAVARADGPFTRTSLVLNYCALCAPCPLAR